MFAEKSVRKVVYNGKEYTLSIEYRHKNNNLIFFIHGLGCTKESFREAFQSASLARYSLLTFDLVGHGESEKPHDFSYTVEEQAGIAQTLLQQFHPAKIHLVAHSMGGAIGLLLAEKLDRKLATFINAEGNLVSEDCGISRKAISVSYENFKTSAFQAIKDNRKNSANKADRLWAQWMDETNPYAFYQSALSLVYWSDSGKLLKKFLTLPCSKHYLYGEKNASKKTKLLQQLHPLVQGSLLHGPQRLGQRPDRIAERAPGRSRQRPRLFRIRPSRSSHRRSRSGRAIFPRSPGAKLQSTRNPGLLG